jgi:hypothetical protein
MAVLWGGHYFVQAGLSRRSHGLGTPSKVLTVIQKAQNKIQALDTTAGSF